MLATDLSEYFGRDRVFQLPAPDKGTADYYTRAQLLFDKSANHDDLLSRINAGAQITTTDAPAMPMFVHTPGKDLHVLTAGDQLHLEAGQELIGLTGTPGTRSQTSA